MACLPTASVTGFTIYYFYISLFYQESTQEVQPAKTDYAQKPKVTTDKICTISLVALNMYKLLQ